MKAMQAIIMLGAAVLAMAVTAVPAAAEGYYYVYVRPAPAQPEGPVISTFYQQAPQSPTNAFVGVAVPSYGTRAVSIQGPNVGGAQFVGTGIRGTVPPGVQIVWPTQYRSSW
jgi:hypothetical protein